MIINLMIHDLRVVIQISRVENVSLAWKPASIARMDSLAWSV